MEKKVHCIGSFDLVCSEECKLHNAAKDNFNKTIDELALILGSKEKALELYFNRTSEEKAPLEAERTEYLRSLGILHLCLHAQELESKRIRRG